MPQKCLIALPPLEVLTELDLGQHRAVNTEHSVAANAG
jgi:hypothetical protein